MADAAGSSPSRADQVRGAKSYLEKLQETEVDALAADLAKLGIDWTVPPKGVGEGGAVGSAEGAPPTPPGAGPKSWIPTMRATTTAAAPRPMGTSLFMMGVLHGPMTIRCRFCSMVARTAS